MPSFVSHRSAGEQPPLTPEPCVWLPPAPPSLPGLLTCSFTDGFTALCLGL